LLVLLLDANAPFYQNLFIDIAANATLSLKVL